jgi:uncharacterized protein YqeY
MTLKEQIQDDMKAAMRAKNVARLGTIRLLISAFRQREIDDQTGLDDLGVTTAIDRMQQVIKQFGFVDLALRRELLRDQL